MKSWRLWRSAAREAAALLGASILLGTLVNAVRPGGLSWHPRAPSAAWMAGDDVFERLSLPEAFRVVQAGERVVLDARPEAAWRTGRIPGAWPLPVERAAAALEHLRPLFTNPDEGFLVYCARADCDESVRLARFLRDQGYQSVAIYSDGFEAWRAAGLPVERSDE